MSDSIESLLDIYRIQYTHFLRKAVRFLGNYEDAQEVMQDVAVRLSEGRMRPMDVRNPQALLNTMVRNRCIDMYRRQLRRAEQPLDTELRQWAADQTTEDSVQAIEYRELMGKLLEGYPQALRQAFCMHTLEGYTVPEIAKQLGVSPKALAQRLRRMRLRLQKRYQAMTAMWK